MSWPEGSTQSGINVSTTSNLTSLGYSCGGIFNTALDAYQLNVCPGPPLAVDTSEATVQAGGPMYNYANRRGSHVTSTIYNNIRGDNFSLGISETLLSHDAGGVNTFVSGLAVIPDAPPPQGPGIINPLTGNITPGSAPTLEVGPDGNFPPGRLANSNLAFSQQIDTTKQVTFHNSTPLSA